MLDDVFQDLRYAARSLRGNAGFAAACVATLALGIGANSAIFSVVQAVLLKPLPYSDAGRLLAVHIYIPQLEEKARSMGVRPFDYLEWRRLNTVFSDIAAFRATALNLTGQGDPERLGALRVSANLFNVLGVRPALGRGFAGNEDTAGSDGAVMLSHAFWERRFGADPAIVNRSILLDGRPFQVAGVLPEGFVFPTGKQFHPLLPLPSRIDVWIPMVFSKEELTGRGNFDYGLIGRLKPGVSQREAGEKLDALSVRLGHQDSRINLDMHTRLIPIRDIFTGGVRQGLLLLLAAVGMLLLISCVNIAGLLLARITGRAREFATRAALGAGRGRIIRQVLTESVLISVLGGAAGLALAVWATRVLIELGPSDLTMLREASINGPVLWFTTGLSILTGLAFGLAPAVFSFRADLQAGLREGGRGYTGGRTERLRHLLVAAEVAFSTALLAAAGLLLHSFVNVMNVDRGFGVERILAADLALPPAGTSEDRRIGVFRDVVRNVAGIPGVIAAGAVTDLPLSNEARTKFIELESDIQFSLDRPVASIRDATPGYFEAVGTPLRAGRSFRDQENIPVAVVSESLARGLWPHEPVSHAVGRRVRQGSPAGPLITIIGVASDVRTTAMDRDPMPQVYRPYTQEPAFEMSLVVRSAQEPTALGAAIREAVRRVDRDLPVAEMRTMREIVSQSVAQRRFQTLLIGLFAALALTLALVGIYGVVSFSVSRRTSEIGLRMALGAQPSSVLIEVLQKGLLPVGIGLLAGTAGAVGAASALRTMLFGVGPLDPAVLGGAAVLLFATAAAACFAPARRASRLDPAIALRHE